MSFESLKNRCRKLSPKQRLDLACHLFNTEPAIDADHDHQLIIYTGYRYIDSNDDEIEKINGEEESEDSNVKVS